MEDTGIMGIKAEVVIPLLYPGVEGATVAPEAHGKQIVLLGRVSQEKCSLWLSLQQRLRCVFIHDSPVAGVVIDLEEVWH